MREQHGRDETIYGKKKSVNSNFCTLSLETKKFLLLPTPPIQTLAARHGRRLCKPCVCGEALLPMPVEVECVCLSVCVCV